MPSSPDFCFEFYVSGDIDTAARHTALVHRALLTLGLPEQRYGLRVVDIGATPEIASANGVTHAPTLIRLWPPPIRVLIGPGSG